LIRLLIVEDDKGMKKMLETYFNEKEDISVISTDSSLKALEILRTEDIDVVVTDMKMPKMSGMEMAKSILAQRGHPEIILITAYAKVEDAVQAIKSGIYDYIEKPLPSLIELERKIRKAYEKNQLSKTISSFSEELKSHYEEIIGKSQCILKLKNMIRKIALSPSTVLITGESGVGKELVAAQLHYRSSRKNMPFIKINCVAIPEPLIESELFGIEKRVATGVDKRKGKFERASGGTIFLDEIGDMNPNLQAKLLRVLEEGVIERIGSGKPIKVDVRVIAATNRNLKKAMEKGMFRQDLFYRLNVISINVPPLRERKEDIPLLTEHFLKAARAKIGKEIKGISQRTMNFFMKYDWPGNVRELKNLIERATVLSEDEVIDIKSLPEDLYQLESSFTKEKDSTLFEKLESFEKKLIEKAMEKANWNQTKAAQILRIKRTALQYKLKKYNITSKNRNG